MSSGPDPEPPDSEAEGEHNSIHSEALSGSFVQAGTIHGDVHFHPDRQPRPDVGGTLKQLPAAVRGFVNRTAEVDKLNELAMPSGEGQPHSVVVIAGSAGVGKTALALYWMHQIREHFTDGDLFVNLRGYGTDEPATATAVLERMLRDLGVAPNTIPADQDDRAVLFRSMIAGRRLLILLDNAAHASQVRPLIPGAAGPLVVVTGRSRLLGLAISNGVECVEVDVLRETDAITLVNQVTTRGRRCDSDEDVSELVRLCARLPLALRIAAERAASRPALGLSEILEDLRDSSGLWETLSVQDGAEIDGVRTVFAWSYRSLPPEAAQIFRAIGMHPGTDISLPAIAAITQTSVRAARRGTDVLVGAFLLEHAVGARFQMHDLLRAYANAESIMHDPELRRQTILDRMCSWYARSADNAASVIAPGDRLLSGFPALAEVDAVSFTSSSEALSWFELERHNILAAARMAEVLGMQAHSFALALAPSPIYMNYFFFDDWAEMTLIGTRAAAADTAEELAAAAQENRGKYLLRRGNYRDAHLAFVQARRHHQQAGNRHGAAESTNSLGLVCLRLRDLGEAARHFASAAEQFDALGEMRWRGVSRCNLAEARIESGAPQGALHDLEDLLSLFGSVGDVAMRGNTLWLLAKALRLSGDSIAGKDAIEQALAIAEDTRNKIWEGFWLIEAAWIQLELGQLSDALQNCQLAAALQRRIGDKSREAMAFHCAGDILLRAQRAEEAKDFHLQAAHEFHDLGETWNEALARLSAADAAAALGQSDSEHEQLHLARHCLAPYSDVRASVLKAGIDDRSR